MKHTLVLAACIAALIASGAYAADAAKQEDKTGKATASASTKKPVPAKAAATAALPKSSTVKIANVKANTVVADNKAKADNKDTVKK